MPVLRECATVSGSKMMEYGRKSGESLHGHVALVTGAAKRLGRAVTLRLRKRALTLSFTTDLNGSGLRIRHDER